MKKRIISYSLYGTDPKYLKGAIANLHRVERIYPGWTCRFYVSQEIPEEVIERLSEKAEVVRKVRNDHIDGMYWRFLAANDDEADAVIVRDVDSIVVHREALAVEEWLASGKNFHVIRDHPGHNARVPGGLWGCRPGALHYANMEFLITQWGRTHPEIFRYKGGDQKFLADAVYPLIKNSLLVHGDGYLFPDEEISPIPTPKGRVEFFFDDSDIFSGNQVSDKYYDFYCYADWGLVKRSYRVSLLLRSWKLIKKFYATLPLPIRNAYRFSRQFLPIP